MSSVFVAASWATRLKLVSYWTRPKSGGHHSGGKSKPKTNSSGLVFYIISPLPLSAAEADNVSYNSLSSTFSGCHEPDCMHEACHGEMIESSVTGMLQKKTLAIR